MDFEKYFIAKGKTMSCSPFAYLRKKKLKPSSLSSRKITSKFSHLNAGLETGTAGNEKQPEMRPGDRLLNQSKRTAQNPSETAFGNVSAAAQSEAELRPGDRLIRWSRSYQASGTQKPAETASNRPSMAVQSEAGIRPGDRLIRWSRRHQGQA
ncbi:hypothetical protein [Gluconobacter oxydans]|uniref:hypothetical protein n=1 Tax=Gluconobacter oxydans TaxID=442 RepID=UPI0015591591|nr:hypothetical protein [Gluconobacter oxydans]